jgi:hypothetical protein
MRPEPLRHACGALLAGVLGACSMTAGLTGPKNAVDSAPLRPASDVAPIAADLEMMSSLPQRDPAQQAEIFQAAKDAAEITPTTANKLRYALALATPGHSGANPVAAQRQLSELLARPETLLPIERLLALVELKEVEQQLILASENKRLRDEAPPDTHDKLAALNRRLAAETDDNARLRKALDEARAKLDAVTHIERSINDRGAGTPAKP